MGLMKYRNRRDLNTSFEADLLDEFTKQCQKEGKYVNQLLTFLMEEYLKNNRYNEEQPKIDLFIRNTSPEEFIVSPRHDASDEDWARYWKTCNEKESGKLEGIFMKRRNEARDRFYEFKRQAIITKTVNNVK